MFKYIIKELDKNDFWEFENYNSIKKIIKHNIDYDHKYNNIYKHYRENIDKLIIKVSQLPTTLKGSDL